MDQRARKLNFVTENSRMSNLVEVEFVGPFESASSEWTVAKEHQITSGVAKGFVLKPRDVVFTSRDVEFVPCTKCIPEEAIKIVARKEL